jgi:hypothetical protein
MSVHCYGYFVARSASNFLNLVARIFKKLVFDSAYVSIANQKTIFFYFSIYVAVRLWLQRVLLGVKYVDECPSTSDKL